MSSAPDSLVQRFDDCAQMLVEGESVAACLARFPDHATYLEPLLSSVAVLRKLSTVPARLPEIAARRRTDFVAAVEGMAALPAGAVLASPAAHRGVYREMAPPLEDWRAYPADWWRAFTAVFRSLQPLPRGLAAVMAGLLLVGMFVTGVAGVSATTLPGDRLYSVKLAGEQARVLFALDLSSRQALDRQFESERRRETAEIMKIRRAVAALPLAGRLESFTADRWWVGGLTVQIDEQTGIAGLPAVGAVVHGTARAPGDGTLVGVRLVVEGSAGALIPSVPIVDRPPPVAAAASTEPAPTATPWSTSATREAALAPPSEAPDAFPTRPHRPLPSPLPVYGGPPPAKTPTATPVPTPLPTPSPVWQPQPRSDPKVRLAGAYVSAIVGARWTVGGVSFDTDGDTKITGNPAIGDKVDALLLVRADGSYLALEIRLVATKAEPFELTGALTAKGTVWVIGGASVLVSAETVITGNPQVGDIVHCAGLRDSLGYHAVSIVKLLTNVVEFSGLIEAVNLDNWIVGGRTVYRGLQTQVNGIPAVGRIADVRAEQQTGGRLVALLIYVRPVTPAPTPVPVTPTNTPRPSATTGPTSTETNTRTPTATNTSVPTTTSTPVPTAAGP